MDKFIIIDGKKYNVSSFVNEHPGGDQAILDFLGEDASAAFHDVGHSDYAKSLLETLLFVEPKKKEESTPKQYKLIYKEKQSHNTSLYRLEIPDNQSLDLPIGKHVSIRAVIDGKEMMRSYTPISLATQKGSFDLVIKTYPQGKISQYMEKLNVGDFITASYPKGSFEYQPNSFTHIGMIAGGTGITPMLQVVRAILADSKDNTKMTLLFANTTKDDILLQSVLDDLSKTYPGRFAVFYILSQAPENWTQGRGRITQEIIQEQFKFDKKTSQILLCGPSAFVTSMREYCEALGFPTIFKF